MFFSLYIGLYCKIKEKKREVFMMQESFNDKNSRKNNNRYGKGKKFQKNNVKQSRKARRKYIF